LIIGKAHFIETVLVDSLALARAFGNTYELLEYLLDLNILLKESRIEVIDSDKDYVDSLQATKVGDVLVDGNSRFLRIPPFTELEALKIRHDFVTWLTPDQGVKDLLRLSLWQSSPLRKSCPREMFDLLIPRFPEVEQAWLRFLERAVLQHCQRRLAMNKILVGQLEPYPSDGHPALYYLHRIDRGLDLGIPVVEESARWIEFKSADSTPDLNFEITRICVPRPDGYWRNLGLKPDGVFFAHRSAHRNRFHSQSIFHYFRPEAHPGREDILTSQCESVFVLEAPIPLIEKTSPLGILHYGFEHDKIFPVFDGVDSLVSQTQERGLNHLLKKGKISLLAHKNLTGKLAGVASFFKLGSL
jgi:hypothetical protein